MATLQLRKRSNPKRQYSTNLIEEGDGEDDGRGAAELGAEGALGLVTTVFTACCIASQLILDVEASVDCGLPEKLKITLFKCKICTAVIK